MPTIWTVGYGGRNPQSLLALLREYQVEELIDIRHRPSSRIPGFSRAALAGFMLANGVSYIHMAGLGNTSRGENVITLANPEEALPVLAQVIEQKRVAIMCAEKSHIGCHRVTVVEQLEAGYVGIGDLEVVHI